MLRTTWTVPAWMMLGVMFGMLPAVRPAAASPRSWISAEAKAVAKQARNKTKARLPKYFAQLKLDDEQRQQILEIQKKYAAQLSTKQELMDATRKELDRLKKDQERDYNRVLKTAQKRRLKELRNRSKRSATTKTKRR